MRSARIIAVACLVFAVTISSPSAATESSLEGTFTANGEKVELTHVYVFPQEKGFYDEADPTWTLLFVARSVAERELDDHIWDSAYIRIGITETSEFSEEPRIEVLSQDIRFSADQPGNISGGTYPSLELTSVGPEGFEGRVWHDEEQEFFDDTFQYDFHFSAPMSDPFAPIGDPLPDGGGEPGAAFIAWCDAIHSGDIDRIKKLVPAEQAAMFDDPSQKDQIMEELEFMKLMTPTEVVVIGGSSDGETAILQVTGTLDGEQAKGEITMTKWGDSWTSTNAAWE